VVRRDPSRSVVNQVPRAHVETSLSPYTDEHGGRSLPVYCATTWCRFRRRVASARRAPSRARHQRPRIAGSSECGPPDTVRRCLWPPQPPLLSPRWRSVGRQSRRVPPERLGIASKPGTPAAINGPRGPDYPLSTAVQGVRRSHPDWAVYAVRSCPRWSSSSWSPVVLVAWSARRSRRALHACVFSPASVGVGHAETASVGVAAAGAGAFAVRFALRSAMRSGSYT